MAEEQQLGLRELLDLAQTALEEGRHQEATVSCRHVLREYPEAATAMRLLGESYLEAGRTDEAGRAFEKVLTLDPFNILARVGLGVLAEDRGEDERAIGQFRLAWEAAPHLPQLRSELVRLYRKRYGVGGRLRMTRVALANLHARNEDLPRAIRQFQQLYAEDTDRIDVAVALAEARWRHCDDREAVAFCHQLLAAQPHLARPLLIAAAIQGDNAALAAGVPRSTEELLASARALDPDAILARDLLVLRPSPTLQAFIDAPVAMTPFDPAVLDVAGTDELLGQRTSTLGEDAFRWEDIAGGLGAESVLARDTGPVGANGAVPAAEEDDVEALFAAIDRQLATTDNGEIAAARESGEVGGGTALLSDEDSAPLAGWEGAQDDEMAPAPDEPTAVERLTANWDNIDNELAAARPTDDAPTGMTGMLSALGDMEADLQPFDVESDAEPEAEQKISFDPSKFSLPPLDGEDDDDLPLELESDELGDQIAPFNLDETGPKVKTGGLTFADLVRNQEAEPTSYSAGNSFTDTLGAEDSAISDISSIFATRELSTPQEDRLLDFQIATSEMPSLSGAPLDPRVLPTTASAPAAEPEVGPVPLPFEATAAAPTPAPQHEEAAPEARWQGEERRRDPAAAISFEALLGADVARLELPEATFFPDATRPLLAADADPFGDDPTAASAPPPVGATDQEGMGNLFDRLRHRKQERIETGDLQIKRRLTPPAQPPLMPTAADASDTPDAAGQSDTRDADTFIPASAEAAQLDDWIVSLDTPERRADAATTTANSGDDWLSTLDADRRDEQPAWELTPAAASQPGEDGVVERRDWGLDFTAETIPAADADNSAPGEDFALVSSPDAATREVAARGDERPTWADEVPPPAQAAREEPAAPVNGAYANGNHAEPPHSVAPPAPQYIPAPPMRDRQAIARRQTDQLASLETLVAANPDNHFARLTLAVAYSAGQPEQALTEYRRLIREAEDLIPEIIERLKEMIADGDAPSRAHRILGDAYMKLGQFDMAMAEFQRALSTRPRAARA